MRISKLWSAVCAATFLAGFPTARAQDNPAQAAARAALMEKLSAPNAQPSPPTARPAAIAVPPPVQAQAAPASTPPPTPTVPADAGDTPAQAAARAALMAKMNEFNSQQTQPVSPGLAPIVLTPSSTAAEQPSQPAIPVTVPPPPVQTQPAPTPTPPVLADAGDTPAQAAARAVLMAKISELNTQQSQTANPLPASGAAAVTNAGQEQPGQPAKATTVLRKPVAPKPAKTQPAPRVTTAPKTTPPPAAAVAPVQKTEPVAAPAPLAGDSSLFTPVPPPSNPGVQAGVPPLSNPPQFNQQPAATPPPKVTAAPPAKPAALAVAPPVKPPPPSPPNVNYPGRTLGFPPVEAPPPPVSAQQQADLQALLGKYMANQISPEEYQKERAAILAKP